MSAHIQGWKVTYFQPISGVGHIIDPTLLSEGPPPPPHLTVFGNNVTNIQQPQPPSFVQSPSPPDFSMPLSHAPSPTPVYDENTQPPSQSPSSQKRGPKALIFSNAAIDKTRTSIKLLLKKRTFEESIIDIFKYVSIILVSMKLTRENI